MDNRMLIPLTILCVAGFLLLLVLRFLPSTTTSTSNTTYITNMDVRGMAVEHKGALYTLNFDQQNRVLPYLNEAIPVSKTNFQEINETLSFSKLVIYTFKGPDIEINPIGYWEDNLVFFAPTWNPSSYLIEISGGQLKSVMAQTYDP